MFSIIYNTWPTLSPNGMIIEQSIEYVGGMMEYVLH